MINENDVKKVAKLARIKLQDDEIEKYKNDLGNIFGVINNLLKVEVDNVARMTNVRENAALPLRQDEVTDGNIAELITKNAPAQKYNYFEVPIVVDDNE